MKICKLALFGGVVGYFLLSFAFKSIGLSIFDEASFEEYRIIEMVTTWVGTLCAMWISFMVCGFREGHEAIGGNSSFVILLSVITFGLYFIPISIGYVIILNLVNLAFITLSSLHDFNDKF